MTPVHATLRQPPDVQPGQLPSPVEGAGPIRGLLFDLDGTLYDQPRMRRLMARELLGAALRRPFAATALLRGLREYRRAQETIRHETSGDGPLDRRQLELAARRAGMTPGQLAPLVREWMDERPLKHLPACRASGLGPLFGFLRAAGVRIGVLSDYPAAAKLQALGIAGDCSPVLCASDPEVGAFKPHPRGFAVACERMGLLTREVLMVGDRADADGAGAAAAGMPCVIIAKHRPPAPDRSGSLVLDSLERLHRVLDDNR